MVELLRISGSSAGSVSCALTLKDALRRARELLEVPTFAVVAFVGDSEKIDTEEKWIPEKFTSVTAIVEIPSYVCDPTDSWELLERICSDGGPFRPLTDHRIVIRATAEGERRFSEPDGTLSVSHVKFGVPYMWIELLVSIIRDGKSPLFARFEFCYTLELRCWVMRRHFLFDRTPFILDLSNYAL